MKKWTGGRVGGVALALSGCVLPLQVEIDGDLGSVRGSGHLVSETRPVSGFDAVSASGAVTVIVERSGRETVSITAEDNLLRYLDTEVRGGVLFVGPRPGVSLAPRREIVVHVEVFEIVEIRGSGAVDMEADLGWIPELWISLSGASSLTLAGAADVADVTLSGASRYDALDVETLDTWIEASGASRAWVWAERLLDARASGASEVRFRGTPTVRAEVSGASTVTRY
ncbi:MAG: DUF2807 domain-containing protein [Gemmatimonadota bacterium]